MLKMNFRTIDDESMVSAMFKIVQTCPYVHQNPDYDRKAQGTEIKFDDSSVVNAYASATSDDTFKILVYKGICDAMKIGSLAVAELHESIRGASESDVKTAFIRFAEIVQEISSHLSFDGRFNERSIYQIAESQNIKMTSTLVNEATSYFAGSLIDLIGHEMGHICLSHVLRPDTGDVNSRNDERQADLFGWAVCESSPFVQYTILGGLVLGIILDSLSGNDPVESETSHPHSRERIYNLVRSHREYLSQFGINEISLHQLLG